MTSSGASEPASLDGVVSRNLNRPISRRLARLLAHTPVTPNQVTIASVLLAAGAGWLLVAGHNVWAAFAIHATSVVDGTDGDLARLIRRSSAFGAVFDAVLDRYADAAIFGGMAWWAYRHESYPVALPVGLLTLTGAFAVSYSRARAEASTGEALTGGLLGLASRDVRLLILAIGCLTGLVYWALMLVAVAANLTVVLRLLHLRTRHGD